MCVEGRARLRTHTTVHVHVYVHTRIRVHTAAAFARLLKERPLIPPEASEAAYISVLQRIGRAF